MSTRRNGLIASLALLALPAIAVAQQGPSLGDCLTGSGSFARCMEEGPLVAGLMREIRKDLAEIRTTLAKNGPEAQWVGYNLRFTESRMMRSLAELFPGERVRLPDSVARLADEVAGEIARIARLRPNPTFETYWSAETRAAVASLPGAVADDDALPVARAPDDTHLIGKKFIEVFAVEDHQRPQPISLEQQSDIGRFQTAALLCLAACQDSVLADIQNELAEYRARLQQRNEEVSSALDHLDRTLIDTILRLEMDGSA